MFRAIAHPVYTRLKRAKALEPPDQGLMMAVIDNHAPNPSANLTHANSARKPLPEQQNRTHRRNRRGRPPMGLFR
jgi:hypothetical protein